VSIAARKERHRAERESRIVAAARAIAEREGWEAVTVRRLAEEIEYSQPVLYSHFENRDAMVAAVAIQGFQELALALQEAARGSSEPRHALEQAAKAYIGYALRHPALYEAMFTLPTKLLFADAQTRPELRAGFEALVSVVAPFCADVEVATESFWAALHGLVELERSGRVRPSAHFERIAFVVRAFAGSHDSSPARSP
jgi:AcrR family transcriptional regulator